MPHLATPGPDTGVFSTLEVRPRSKPTKLTSRNIAFPANHYTDAPNVAAGFKMLDLSHEAPIRANLVGSDMTPDGFKILFETWGGGRLYAAEAQWIEHKKGAKECFFGQLDTRDIRRRSRDKPASSTSSVSSYSPESSTTNGTSHTRGNPSTGAAADAPDAAATARPGASQQNGKKIRFPRPFDAPPQVVCWLNRIDMASGDERNWRIHARASRVSATGFVAHLDAWGDTLLDGAALCWIAFPADKPKVASGTFATTDVRAWHDPRQRNSGRVRFRPGAFARPPTVLVALNMLDMAGNADLRVKVYVDEVDQDGFTWHLDTWEDSTMYQAAASWIALGFV